MNLKIAHRLCIILVSISLLYGCTKEDLSDCSFQLQLNYDYNMEDNVVSTIDFVDLYIFDQHDKFVESMRVDASELVGGYQIDVPTYYRDQTLVVWAREMLGSYHIPSLEVGDDIEMLTLKLIAEGDVSSVELANLLHGGSEVMTFSQGRTHTINFTRTNKVINLALTGSNNEAIELEGAYDVKITACNGHYSSDHSIIPDSPIISYRPTNYTSARSSKTSHKVANLHTLRLTERYIDDVKLSIFNKESGSFVTFEGTEELKLVEYLLKTKPEGVSAQEYLDRKSIWDISFSISSDKNIALSITINGWVLRFNSTDL